MRAGRHIVPLSTLVLAGILLVGRTPVAAVRQARASVEDLAVGRLLVAERDMGDPTFARTVVLLLVYQAENGAAGVILNRPTSLPIPQVLPDLPTSDDPASQVFFGGPVQPGGVRALIGSAVDRFGALPVLPDVGLLGAGPLTRAIERGLVADRLRVYAGYAGWSPGQLEGEVRRGDWHILDGSSEIIFDDEPDTIWERQIRLADVFAT